MRRMLLVTNETNPSQIGGRALLCDLNRSLLREIFGPGLAVHRLPRTRIRGAGATIQAFQGHIDGIDSATLQELGEAIAEQRIDQVFIDGSNLGEIARAIKSRFPRVEILTFFHNVEARFFLGSFRRRPGVHSLAVMVANYLAERKAVRYSDKLISLSDRDSRLLAQIYGRGATHVAPLALSERAASTSLPAEIPEGKFALFVGGAFYANLAGIEWYAAHVAPHVPMKTYAVGHGLEQLREKLTGSSQVEIVGSVPHLAPWYRRAHVVVAPIFDGSGMKTKVAEALMFGKRVVGTPEAFSGYEDVAAAVGQVCGTADEFIAALRDVAVQPFLASDPALRTLYEQKYSYQAALHRLQQVLGNPVH